jgi:electron transport complex protein RnfG
MDKQLPVWASVALVSLISAVLLVSTHLLTNRLVPPEGMIGTDSPQGAAMPAAERFIPVETELPADIDSLYAAQAGGEAIGYAAQTTVSGYAGPIEVVVGMDLDGRLTGISVGGDQFNETPGLGSKAQEPEFTSQFSGIETPVGLKGANGGAGETAADAASGATPWVEEPAEDAAGGSSDAASGATPWVEAPAEDASGGSSDAASGATPWVEAPAEDAAGGSSDAASGATPWVEAPAEDASGGSSDAASGATPWVEAPAEDAAGGSSDAAAQVDGLSGATVTSRAVIEGVNRCAEALKALLAGGGA